MDWRSIRRRAARRKQRWAREILPRIRDHAARPNAAEYLQQPAVANLLQHLSTALAEVLVMRPLAPFAWLAERLRHLCKLVLRVEPDAVTLLQLEMHKKRRVIENALQDTKADEIESKQLIRATVALEQELALQDDESRLARDDLDFLRAEPPSRQENWSGDASSLAFPGDGNSETDAYDPLASVYPMPAACDDRSPTCAVEQELQTDTAAWLREFLLPQRGLDAYHFNVMDGVIRPLVSLQLVRPSCDDAAVWFVALLRGEQATPSSSSANTTAGADAPASLSRPGAAQQAPRTLSLFFKTNYELMRRVDRLKCEQRAMHARRARLQAAHAELTRELAARDRFIAKLSASRVTTRTHALMDGTPVFLNAQKHWVLPGALLVPSELSDAELLALRRAENYLMHKDEARWKRLLTAQERHDASVAIQSVWRCARAARAYKALQKRRAAAARVIQRNYFQYLFHRAVRVPAWCILGREVLVAPSVAYKCGIAFQFYPRKDFPAGNYRRLPAATTTVSEMLEICRQDDECAGFSTDGAMKRFLPRKLSQLQDMALPNEPGGTDSHTRQALGSQRAHGLYVKVLPRKTDVLVNTGIIVAVPDDRFGLVHVALDGTGIVERVPLARLNDRWKRIRIRFKQKRATRAKRTFVFGQATDDSEAVAGGAAVVDDVRLDLRSPDASAEFDTLDDDDNDDDDNNEVVRRRRRRHRQRLRAERVSERHVVSDGLIVGAAASSGPEAAAEDNNDDNNERLGYLYEDQATKRVLRREPQRTHSDADARARVITEREQQRRAAQATADAATRLASVVRLQCAWRSKRARDAFRQVLELRAKEKAREQLVLQAHARAPKAPTKSGLTTPSARFFSRLFKR
ncbi:hypothetical protein PybrP1_001033 [[Pythium] brassicae (nom. inval.)]|nr:hypothetical protein PybrP1_001033 [[Pythium] brassicae (nom. inval.)]